MNNKKCRRLWLGFDRALSHDLLRQLVILLVALVAALCLSYLFLSWSGAKWEDFCHEKDLNKWLLPVYLLIDSNVLSNLYMSDNGNAVHGWMLIASSLTFLFGAFVFNGVIIGIINNAIERRVQSHQEGHIHYLKAGHHIIMGYDDMVPSFISSIFSKDKDAYILILTSADVPEVKEKLSKSFDEQTLKHVIVNYGHRISADAFKDIYLEAAQQVFVVGNHKKPAHDAVNVECVDSICRYLSGTRLRACRGGLFSGTRLRACHEGQHPQRITCVFKDLDTYAAFKTSEIFREVGKLGMEFVPYNHYNGWAKQVFVKREYRDFDNPQLPPYKYPPVYGQGIKPDDDRYVHLVFVGTTNFAVAFAMEAANVLHFPNADKARTRITFIDRNADKEKDEFIVRNRHFFEVQPYYYSDLTKEEETEPKEEEEAATADQKKLPELRNEYLAFKGSDAGFLDVEFEFIKGDIFSKKVQDTVAAWAAEHGKQQYLSVFLALSDQRENFVMGMNLPDAVYDNAVPLFIRQDRSDNFVTNLRNADKRSGDEMMPYSSVGSDGKLTTTLREARYAHIYPFGMNETAYSEDDHSMKRAKLINYLYETADYSSHKFQSTLALNEMSAEQIWQEADKYWRDLTVALKWSNLYCAYTIRTKLACLRAMRHLDVDDDSHDLDTLTEYEAKVLALVEHNRWNVEKLLMGFRKPRPEEDKYVHDKHAGQLKKNKNLFIHHDIRPFKDLNDISELDYEFCRYIPWIMKMTE